MNKFTIIVAFLITVGAEYVSYDGHKLYEVVPKNLREVRILKMFDISKDVDFWTDIRKVGAPVSVMVGPKTHNAFVSVLYLHGIEHNVLVENIEAVIQQERIRHASAPKVEKGEISFTDYNRYQAIRDYLAHLAQNYSSIVTLEDLAISYEGRPVIAIKISTGGTDKPIMLVDGGMHAREWISPAMVLYIINQLVENPNNRNLIETVDWYIIPVVNPDGYEYSHTVNRMWRKSRRPGKKCVGVDPNRNFDFHWMETGASNNDCSEAYAGPKPFSESECIGLARLVSRNKGRIKFYLSFHSFGPNVLFPWGWTTDLPDNGDQLYALATDVAAAIGSVAGTNYTVGSSSSVAYRNTGSSIDWIMGVGGVNLSYGIELPGDGFGFCLPRFEIKPVVEETWQGVLVFHKHVANLYAKKS